jgi:hypothetical protein
VTFPVYISHSVVSEVIPIYLFGFLDRKTLVGGYRMPLAQVEPDLEFHVLHGFLFFHESWAAGYAAAILKGCSDL